MIDSSTPPDGGTRTSGAALLLALRLTVATFDRRRLAERLLFGGGVLLLGLYAAAFVEAKAFNAYQDLALSRRQLAASPEIRRERLAAGELIGRLEIERVGVRVAVMEGTSSSVLRRAVGHVESTALPGEAGNIAIAGHRDTHFSGLGDVRPGDLIVLVTAEERREYKVENTLVTEPDDLSQLDRGDGERLTLITCYPFHWVGPAPKRFIVHATREPSRG